MYPRCSKVGFIGFKRTRELAQWRGLLTGTSHACPQPQVNRIDRAHRQTSQTGCIGGGQIHAKVAQQLPEFSLGNFRAPVAPNFYQSFQEKLARFNREFAS
jgi:hypothetical protein